MKYRVLEKLILRNKKNPFIQNSDSSPCQQQPRTGHYSDPG